MSFDAAEKARQGPMTHDTALARRVAEMEASRFWKPVVRRLYSLYVQHKRHLWLEICAQLSAGHWRQLMDWAAEVRKFLDAAPHCCSAPPPLPLDLLAYILACYVRGQVTSVNRCLAALTCPLWYLETMLVVRLLLGGPKGGRGFRVPSRAVQFTMQLGSSLAVSAFVRTMGATWHEDLKPTSQHGREKGEVTKRRDVKARANEFGWLSEGCAGECGCVPCQCAAGHAGGQPHHLLNCSNS